MLRVVLDTNIVVSGTFWSGASFRVLKLIGAGKLLLVASPSIVAEYLRVMQSDDILEKTGVAQRETVLSAIHKLLLCAKIVEPQQRVEAVEADPDDNKFLEAALAGKADFIVSKDKHLLNLGEYEGVQILAPEAVLNLIENK